MQRQWDEVYNKCLMFSGDSLRSADGKKFTTNV